MGRAAASPVTVPRVRAAQLGDASDVAGLLGTLGYPCTRDEASERIAAVIADRRRHLLLAEIDGVACGLIAMDTRHSLTRGAEFARIPALVVLPACSRQGIGRRLLREAEAIARRAGVIGIEVTSHLRHDDAHAFYRSCGYGDGPAHFIKRLGD